MDEILQACSDVEQKVLPAGQAILEEGRRAGVLYVLIEGEVEVCKGEYAIHVISDPGAVFGEISVLLDAPHTATVRTTAQSRFHVIEDPLSFLHARPAVALGISRLLAERLHSMTTYLVDLKRQYEDSQDHFGMVDEVLETLGHAQRAGHVPGSDRDPDPTVS
ncbi:MAG TPA: cyclic nucleotide-binding domain-containing protein [Candidatus Binatia bacterium]|nr:cyclic nucleotide-binding domain-containing protein [Candidatus Binatia bacterium]